MIMDIDVKKIDTNDKNSWRTIYEEIYVPYFGQGKLFPKPFIDKFKMYPNEPQKIPNQIKNNV